MTILPKDNMPPQEQAEFFAKHRLGSDYDFRQSSDYVRGYIEGVKRYIEDMEKRERLQDFLINGVPYMPEDCVKK